jgi:hypothetical protein
MGKKEMVRCETAPELMHNVEKETIVLCSRILFFGTNYILPGAK